MALTIKPIADRVVVEAAPAEEKTASGLYIPDTAKEKPQRGKVIAVGNGKVDEPMTVKVGDEVLYGKYAGTEQCIFLVEFTQIQSNYFLRYLFQYHGNQSVICAANVLSIVLYQ